MQSVSIARNILLLGLVFVFLAFGIDKFVQPILWIGWIPGWMNGLLGMNADLWLKIIGRSREDETLKCLDFLAENIQANDAKTKKYLQKYYYHCNNQVIQQKLMAMMH